MTPPTNTIPKSSGEAYDHCRDAASEPSGVNLIETPEGLSLVSDGMELRGDFTRLLPRIKQGRLQQELLVKAAKIKGAKGDLTVLDATAGLGEDSFLLAAAGYTVDLYERDPIIAALLEDTLVRAARNPRTAAITARMHAHAADSVAAMAHLSAPPDVILLDPMFPARTKSAAVKKKFQLIHHLEKPCEDENALVQAALDAKPRKVVIKRPPKGPYLAGVKPTYSLKGKAVRYDVIVIPR